jgi:predicted dehydrogenase
MHNVGIVGAGPGTWALHLPTLAAFADDFRVVHIADSGGGRADLLAHRAGIRASSTAQELMADPDVDVIAICTPPATHAPLILDAVRAGKRAIFCEKPIATTHEELEAVLEACTLAGVTLVVGTNHLFDPAWSRVKHHLNAAEVRVLSVSATLSLAPNGRYHDVVADAVTAPAPPARPPIDPGDRVVSAHIVRQLVVGLAIHDLPLIRDLAPAFDAVTHARPIAPIGYDVGFVASGALVRLTAVMNPAGADTMWRLRIVTTHDRIEVDFPPPFVHAGGARVRVWDEGGRLLRFATDHSDGYFEEWRALAELLRRERPMEYEELEADARFAIDIADAAAAHIREGGVR